MSKNWSEDNFIEYLAKQFTSNNALMGIGDDCAVIPGEASGKVLLVTTDALVEGVHFLKDEIPPEDLGYKTIAVNVSDINAMGGIPKYAFFSVAVPKHENQTWFLKVIDGIKKACEHWDISLLGGDTVGSKRDLFLNLTLIGSADADKIKYRHQACEGDVICVTGTLGDAGGGLKVLQKRVKETDYTETLLRTHFHPAPNLKIGTWLASHDAVHAMMDLSDGLDCDLKRLLKSSQKGAIVDISMIPISNALRNACQVNDWDPLEQALTGGEDYRLLFTVDSSCFEEFKNCFQNNFEIPLFAIGTVTENSGLYYRKEGKEFHMDYQSFKHF